MPHSSADMAYGVSNSFRRGLPRTYSRRTRGLDGDGPPHKLIRMDDDGFVRVETNSRTAAGAGSKQVPVTLDEPAATIGRDVAQLQDQESVSSFAPSTPVRETIFSDPAMQASSPLSSPGNSPPVTKTYKPAFNLLKRKRSDSAAGDRDGDSSRPATPLTEITGNDRYASQAQLVQSASGRNSLSKKPRLTQMTLDLGQDTRRTCKGCGMSYIPSSAEDAALHKSFHSTNIGGVDVGRSIAKDVKNIGVSTGENEVVVMVDRKSGLGPRRKVEKVLEVVQQDLGALEIDPERLWSSMPCPVSGRKFGKALARAKEKGEEEEPREDCFKAFLFLDRDRCVGLCLAERINNALEVVDSEAQQHSSTGEATGAENNKHAAGIRSSSVQARKTTSTVLLGISRVWTSRSHRRKGIASLLLDCARANYFYGIEVPKEMVAFSQPTESGGQLARRWYEKPAGWHVYEC